MESPKERSGKDKSILEDVDDTMLKCLYEDRFGEGSYGRMLVANGEGIQRDGNSQANHEVATVGTNIGEDTLNTEIEKIPIKTLLVSHDQNEVSEGRLVGAIDGNYNLDRDREEE